MKHLLLIVISLFVVNNISAQKLSLTEVQKILQGEWSVDSGCYFEEFKQDTKVHIFNSPDCFKKSELGASKSLYKVSYTCEGAETPKGETVCYFIKYYSLDNKFQFCNYIISISKDYIIDYDGEVSRRLRKIKH